MAKKQKKEKLRVRETGLGIAIIVTMVVITATALGLYYGLRDKTDSPDEPETVEPDHVHTYILNNDSYQHWEECSVCGDITNIEDHTLFTDNEDGTTHKVSCEVCGYEALNDPHGFIYINDSVDTGHHRECQFCGYVDETIENHNFDEGFVSAEPTCVDDGTTVYTCTLCNATKSEPITALGHDPITSEYLSDENGHWYACSRCDEKIDYTAHSATIDNHDEYYHWQECVCGYVSDSQKSEHDLFTDNNDGVTHTVACETCGYNALTDPHDYGDTYVSDDTGHHQECQFCGHKTDSVEHVWDSGTVIDEGSCVSPQITKYTCSLCGATKQEEEPATGHSADESEYIMDENGHWYNCSLCGEQVDITYADHSYADTYNHDEGYHWKTCTVCGYVKDEEEHSLFTYIDENIHSVSCETCGYTASSDPHTIVYVTDGDSGHHAECQFCEYKSETIVGHSWDSGEITTENDCTNDGVRTYTCVDCGDTKTEAIPATGHSYVDSFDENNHYEECTICGEKINSASHNIVCDGVTKIPTETSEGAITYSCSGCNYSYDVSIAETHGLELDSWEYINQMSELGIADQVYKVGETKTLTLTTNESVELAIYGFNHDTLSTNDSSYNNNTGKAGITLGMTGVLANTAMMNSEKTNAGGWNSSELRAKLQSGGEIFETLPDDVQAVIKTVNKETTSGNASTSITTSKDQLFLLSQVEILETTTDDGYKSEGTTYEYWKTIKDGTNASDRIRYDANGTARVWWTRTPILATSAAGTQNFRASTAAGALNGVSANGNNYVSFLFCV